MIGDWGNELKREWHKVVWQLITASKDYYIYVDTTVKNISFYFYM